MGNEQESPLSASWSTSEPHHNRTSFRCFTTSRIRLSSAKWISFIKDRVFGLYTDSSATHSSSVGRNGYTFLGLCQSRIGCGSNTWSFEPALHPQQPYMREDGSYNTVADDGQLCGAAPEWSYPLWCCDQLIYSGLASQYVWVA